MKSRTTRNILIWIIIIAGILLLIDITTGFFGNLVNMVHPCVDIPNNSAPCSLGYDFDIVMGLGAVVLVAVLILVVRAAIAGSKKSPRGPFLTP